MAEKQLSDSLNIGPLSLSNRICVPPMLSNWSERAGEATSSHVAHYRAIAAGGPGLVVVEAACVSRDGRLHPGQLGIWDDAFIPGLGRIAAAVKGEGCPAILQIHHGGALAMAEDKIAPSVYSPRPGVEAREATPAELQAIADDFVEAGVRACRAGFDGVELHGCHGYLLSEFFNREVNRRADEYGREPERFAVEILHRLRDRVPADFVIGVRLGAFEPTLEDGLRNAKKMEAAGIGYISISYGCQGEHQPLEFRPEGYPAGYPFKDVVWAAGECKKTCAVPVIAVNGIRTPEDARRALALTGVDMIAVGRSVLCDPDWPKKALRNEATGRCLDCSPCRWRTGPDRCAGRRAGAKPRG